jgi:hypothetical protein
MTKSPTFPTQPSAGPTDEVERSFWRTLSDLFEKNPLANGLFALAIVIGFFHGWLKLHFRSALTTFAFDIPVIFVMVLTFASRRDGPLFPKTGIGDSLKFHVLLCLLYIPLSVVIWEVPIFAAIAAFRGWAVIPMIFLVGYHLVSNIRQVEFFMWMMIGLGFVTAIYGIQQSEEEVRRMMLEDPEFQFRFQNQFYAVNGVGQFRRFSTFVSSAAFAAQLAYSSMFAFSRLSVKTCPIVERVILASMTGVMVYALILTGARSGMLQLIAGILFAVWYRRGGLSFILLPIIFTIAWKAGNAATSGVSTDRFATLMEADTIWWRVWIVVGPSIDALLDAPFGTGLGSSSHGVPMFLMPRLKYFRPIDGDLGHMAVDMGILGLASVIWLFYNCARSAYSWMGRLRDTTVTVIALPSGIFMILSLFTFPIGTPFLGIPYGTLLWFFLGALSRMSLEYEKAVSSGVTSVSRFQEKFTSFIATSKLVPLYRPAQPDTGASLSPVTTTKTPVQVLGIVRPGSAPAVYTGSSSAQPSVPSARSDFRQKRFLFPKKPKGNG